MTLFAREWQPRDRVSASQLSRSGWTRCAAWRSAGQASSWRRWTVCCSARCRRRRCATRCSRSGSGKHDLRALAERLTAAGYVRCEQVEGAGQFAVRGGILDVYSPMSAPVRVEFFDTEIDAMGEFDVATQRRTKNLEELTVLPAAEVLPFAAETRCSRMEHAAAQLAKR